MDQLPGLGRAIGQVVGPTFGIYKPLLLRNKDAIRSTPHEAFSYGPTPRQCLDVYYPPSSVSRDGNRISVLVFIHGGGFVTGARTIPDYAEGLAHSNVGHFFAENTATTVVIPDYRLISHGARFPSGGEDVALVIDWIRQNLSSPGKAVDLYLMGNSAGGVHLSTFLLGPAFSEARTRLVTDEPGNTLRLQGVILLSVPFHFEASTVDRADSLKAYYGDDRTTHSPLGLLRTAKQQLGGVDFCQGVGVMILNGTLDPEDEILIPKDDFLEEWNQTEPADMRHATTVGMMEGQNHISPALSLGTGITGEEKWGYQVRDFMVSCRKGHD